MRLSCKLKCFFLNQSSIFVSGSSRYLNYIFTGIFIIEAIIRLIAMRLDYFKLGWNVFDFIIVVFSIVGELIVAREFFIINLFSWCYSSLLERLHYFKHSSLSIFVFYCLNNSNPTLGIPIYNQPYFFFLSEVKIR